MRISDIERQLATERAQRGDVEVVLHGYYGAESTTFTVMTVDMADCDLASMVRDLATDGRLHVWTDINTG